MTAFAAAFCSSAVAFAVLLRRHRTAAAWCFVAGMVILAVESALDGFSLAETDAGKAQHWQTFALMAKSFAPSIWLGFSLTYSRGDSREFLSRWRFILLAALIIPVGLAFAFRTELVQVVSRDGSGWWVRYGTGAWALNVAVLIATVGILSNLEKTFRAAVGTMRWKIKFAILGLGIIFGTRIYARSQALLYSGYDLNLTVVEAGALIIGCALIVVAYLRRGFAGIDIYPSQAVLQSSVTVLLVGGYLFVVGVLAQLAAYFGGAGNFQFQALVVLAGVAVLAVLLFSDRLRQRIRAFVSRHFSRPQHDSRAIWTLFTRRLSTMAGQGVYCAEAVKLVAETFQVLSVTLWLFDGRKECLVLGATTAQLPEEAGEPNSCITASAPILAGLREVSGPFDLEPVRSPWTESLRRVSQPQFRKGGTSLCVPLMAGERGLGVAILADRVNGVPYSVEERDLLKCIGDQVAAGLLQFQLTDELMQGRELEAFQAMSTFFVHDLKNAASNLNLMLENLPVHFDDPAFREDAFRAIARTADRINQIIGRLGALRQKLELKLVETDLNQLVTKTIAGLGNGGQIELITDLQPMPPVMADREQLENVVTNLVLNAREAMDRAGKITLRTTPDDGRAVLLVTDNGCGMTAAFVRDSLFRPFRTTKKKGLGIGMFQSRMIVEAHHGTMQVESEPGQGTTFRVSLPLKSRMS